MKEIERLNVIFFYYFEREREIVTHTQYRETDRNLYRKSYRETEKASKLKKEKERNKDCSNVV